MSEDTRTLRELIEEDKARKKEMIRRGIQRIKRVGIMDVTLYPFRVMVTTILEIPMVLICAMEMFLDYVLPGGDK